MTRPGTSIPQDFPAIHGARVPQVLVTLSPTGELQMELPGAAGTRRVVALARGGRSADKAYDTIQRVLQAQASAHYAIGEDGAPTEGQVRHWERHGTWPDERCPWCRHASSGKNGRAAPQPLLVNHGGVKVRRVAPGRGIKPGLTSAQRAEDLGL